MTCPKCGYMMSAFDKDCPRCHGQGIAPAQPSSSSTQQLPSGGQSKSRTTAITPVTTPATTPIPSSNQTYCNSCGTPNANTASFCSGCGQSTAALASVPPQTISGTWVAPPQPPPVYQHPPQNNVNVVVTQQNNNNNSGWWAAILLLLFGTPLGCIAIPAALVLMAVAFQFTPMIIAVFVAIAIGKSTLDQDKKIIGIVASLVVGAALNGVLLAQLRP